MVLLRSSVTAPRRGADAPVHRHDVDGLRAVAILLVVVYHVWFARVSGGVDVFLMLSAFFLTGSFLRRMHAGQPIAPGRYWLRTFGRLLPAAAVTLLGVLVLALVIYPATRWSSIWEQTLASLTYTQNWVLAANTVDYYARSEATSPLQHFWSLSVQGQVFLLWPLLLSAAAIIVRRFRLSPTVVVGAIFGAIFVVSLGYSVVRTANDQQFAYFDTGARLWEFAAGSLVAVLLPFLRLPARVRAVAGWLGLAGIVLCGLLIDVRGGFPGYLALWPVLCAAAIVLTGGSGVRGGPNRLLESRPLRAIGRDAYALYLVHWPILVTWLVVTERTEVGLAGGIFLLALSLVLARVVTFVVDRPLRRWSAANGSRWVSVGLIAASVGVVAIPVVAWDMVTKVQSSEAAAQAAYLNPGAAVLIDPDWPDVPDAPLIPVATELDADWIQLGQPCAGRLAEIDPILTGTCAQTPDAERAGRLLVVMGDSHAQQVTAAFLPAAREHGWGVVMLVRGGCAMGMDEPGADEGCPQWRDAAIAHAEALAPDAVVTVVTRADAGEDDEALRPGIESFIDRIRAADIDIVAVRDNPRFPFDMYECIGASGVEACAVPRSSSLAETNPAEVLAGPGIALLDLTPYLCPDDFCPPVVGNVAVYRDDNHMSGAYSRTLAPVISGRADVAPL
ncbi:acyltransferase family protein [Microbacterium sp. cx-59]|uniref:acyltransferase family protein n=1 Tax=Microbacterium sp. cx-59 TaxID=2891207 RepID=UPI001E3B7FF8|nr:acyltransferase family protein [Microbacterium sp. cx-59]MCC4907838.1 acyltransferase [Microbacterium sp. cx-59]